MQLEAEKVQEQYQQDIIRDTNTDDSHEAPSQQPSNESIKSKKKNKKSKAKNNKMIPPSEPVIRAEPIKPNKNHLKSVKAKKQSKTNANSGSNVALTSILLFLLLIIVNIGIIYMIMFKNPEIGDKVAEYIPHQYRDWILTKTEFLRLRVDEWISQFRTPPEEQ